VATRVLAASAFAGWLPPPLKLPSPPRLRRDKTAAPAFAEGLRCDKLGEGNQTWEDRRPATAGKLRSAGENAGCGSQLWRGLEPDFPLWRIRRQNVKGFAHVPRRQSQRSATNLRHVAEILIRRAAGHRRGRGYESFAGNSCVFYSLRA
jgi:hypothetical protein